MKRPASLTLRLTLLFSTVATVVLLAFGWIIERSLDNHFDSEDIKELNIIAQAVAQSISGLQSDDELARIKQRFDDILVGHHSALLHITDAAGESLYTSPGLDFSSIPLPAPEQLSQGAVQLWSNAKHRYRVLIQQVAGQSNGPYTVITAVAIDFHLHFLKEFHRTLWLMIICGITVMGLMGWIAVRHGHRPLHHIVDRISRISANELNARLAPETVPAELTELATSFNELLQRMEESFTQLANFSADIAHELRTPVTNLMTQTQVVLSQARTAAEYQEILYSNMEEYERMAQMIGDMLFLAKADNKLSPPNLEDINLKNELCQLFDYYEAWAEERHVSLTLDGDAYVQGDRLMLRRALSNLLSNAIRHTPSGNAVNVQLSRTDDHVVIVVQNPGTPVPAEHLSRLFDRFYRVDASRQRDGDGAGLGLAIVKSIVEAHGGNIVATSNGAGTHFRINLPALTGSAERHPNRNIL
ncbi:MAG: two-component sensor histidine kinase [Gammaproteobacteria bacterium]|nr:MAG: two-component sensor histidine kinase [Gammaproteobacteria bacterium]